jgi:hypothetical protein
MIMRDYQTLNLDTLKFTFDTSQHTTSLKNLIHFGILKLSLKDIFSLLK